MAVMAESLAPSSRTTYRPYVRRFLIWCASRGINSTTIRSDSNGHLLRGFLASMTDSKYALSTIRVALSAITSKFRIPSWTTHADHAPFMRGVARLTAKPPSRKRPFRSRWLRRLARRAADAGSSDNPELVARMCLLSVGFYGALRRSEIAALNVSDVRFSHARAGGHDYDFALVTIRHSKTDQISAGQVVTLLPTRRACCPLFWLRRRLALLPASGSAPLFLIDGVRVTPANVAWVVKDVIRVVAPSHSTADYAGHSLRRGGLTALASAGAPPAVVQQQARHRDPRSTAGYIQPSLTFLASAFRHA